MSGYFGYSMSNNAVAAYRNGEKPISKWTKADILTGVRDCISLQDSDEIILALSKVSVAILRKNLLVWSGWHHTSSRYNRTDFYSLDTEACKNLTKEDILTWVKKETVCQKSESELQARRVLAEWDEWSGSRRHPVKRTVQDSGTIKGIWFFPDTQGMKKKKVNGNWFRILNDLPMNN